jgi:hypothetical protein
VIDQSDQIQFCLKTPPLPPLLPLPLLLPPSLPPLLPLPLLLPPPLLLPLLLLPPPPLPRCRQGLCAL